MKNSTAAKVQDKYVHLISFSCKFHNETFYTLYTTTSPQWDKKKCLNSLRQGAVWGKSGGKERTPQIVELAKKYVIEDCFSIKSSKVDSDSLRPTISAFNKKYNAERDNFIIYMG
jgi:hypothetical protein